MKPARRARAASPVASPAAALSTADAALLLLKGLNFLLAQADRPDLKPAARILAAAREDLAGWAADRSHPPSQPEAYIYRQLFDSGLFPAAAMMLKIGAIKHERTRREIAGLFGLPL